jgi:hypothetical protein
VRIRKRSCAARRVDLVSFGRAYIATPDLVERFAAGAPLAMPSRETFYTGNARGYVDYPRAGEAGNATDQANAVQSRERYAETRARSRVDTED